MAEPNASTIVFDGDSTGAVAALTAVDVAAKRAAASLQSTGAAIDGVGEGANIDKTTAKVKSLREAILRNGDAILAEADAYGQVDKAIQKIAQKKQKVELFTNELDYLKTAEAYLTTVKQKQKEVAESESRQIAENTQWNALRLQKINEIKSAELAAIREAEAANDRKAAKEEAALNSYITRTRNAAVELQAYGKLPSERAAIYGKEFGLPSAEVAKQTAYLKSLEDQLAKTGSRYNEMGMTAKGTAAALRQVPAQVTDIVVSLQGGQAPLTVLLQQGGQLKDVFGGVGNAAKALGGYILGLVNPFTVVAGTVGVVGLAAYRASEDVKALRTALIATGTQGITSLTNLDSMAAGLNKLGVSTATSSEALVTFITAGAKVDSRLQEITKAAIDLEKVGGASIEDTAKKFVALAKDPLADFDKLTLATYKQIEALLEQGNRTEAVTFAQNAFIEATKESEKAFKASQGFLDTAIASWKELGISIWDTVKAVSAAATSSFKSATGDQVRNDLQKRRDIYAAQGYDTTKEDAQLEYFKRIDAAQKQQNDNLSKEITLKGLLAKFNEQDTAGKKQRELNQGITDYKTLLDAGQISVKQYTDAIKKLSEVKEAKAGKPGLSEAEKANAAAVKADIAGAKEMEALRQKALGTEMKAVADLAEAKAKAFAKSAEAYGKELDARAIANADQEKSAYAYVQSVEEGIKRTDFEISLMGQTEQARAIALGQYEIELRLQKQILEVKKSIADESVKDQAIASLNATAIREKSAVANRVMVDEFKKTSDSINSTLTDALMRGFESGKGFAKNMRDTVVNMFKTMVLRPIISAVMSPIAGAITGGLGLSGAAQAASGGNSLLSAASGASSLYSMGSATLGGLASGATSIGSILGATGSGVATAATYGTAIGSTQTAMLAASEAGMGLTGTLGGLTNALAAVPVWGWIALAGLAAGAMLSGGETRSGARYGVGADGKAMKLEGPSGGEIASTQVRGMFDAAKSSIEGMLTGLGSKAVLTGYTAALESSDNGKGFAYATGAINGKSFGDTNTINNMRGDKTAEQAIKDYQLNLSQSILEALQVTEDLPASVATLITKGLNGAAVTDLSQGAIDTILGTVSKLSGEVNTFNTAMSSLPFEGLKNLSFDAAEGLIAAAGGFDKLDASLGNYYTKFYTAEEQRTVLLANTTKAFADIGVTLPEITANTRAWYRAQVDWFMAQDQSIPAHAQATAQTLALADAMDQLAPALESATTAATPAKTRSALKEILDSVNGFADAAAASAASVLDVRTQISDGYIAAQDAVATAQQKITDLSRAAADNMMRFSRTIADFLGTISPATGAGASLNSLKAQFSSTSVLAKAGDAGAQDRLLAEARQVLDTAKTGSRTAIEFARSEAFVRNLLTDVQTAITPAASALTPDVAQTAMADAVKELAAAQTLMADYAAAIEASGGELAAKSETTAQTLLAAYDAAVQAQALTNMRLDVALAALNALGLTPESIQMMLDGKTGAAPGDFAQALGVSDEAITSLQAAVGWTDAELQSLSDALNVTVSDTIYADLSTSLGIATDLSEILGVSLGVSPDELQAITDALGISPIEFMALQNSLGMSADQALLLKSALGLSTEQSLALTTALGVDTKVLSTLGVSLGWDAKKIDTLATAIGISGAAAITLKSLASSVGFSQAAADIYNGLAGRVGFSKDAIDTVGLIGESIGLKANILTSLGSAIGLSSEAKAALSSASIGSTQSSTDPIDMAYQMLFGRTPEAVGKASWQASGLTGSAMFEAIRANAAGSDIAAKRLRGFAVGTNYVPADGPAYLHQGEAVIPKAYNPAAGGQQNNSNAELIDEIRSLKAAVSALQKAADSSATSNAKTANTLIRVTRDGNALLTTAA